MLGGRVLRSHIPAAVDQEIYALLAAHQILRIAIVDATDTVPAADPPTASFAIALETAREQIINAVNVIADTVIDLLSAGLGRPRGHRAGRPSGVREGAWLTGRLRRSCGRR
jgi:hypothetical protein